MTLHFWIELFGYVGSAMVVLSMLMTSVVKLRVINGIGSIISGTYALIVGSFPLALMNLCLIIINFYNLYRLLRSKKQYDLVRVGLDEGMVRFFLRRNLADIRRYFPEFEPDAGADRAYMVCHDGQPVGLLLAREAEDGSLEAVLDYTTQAYRDSSVGTFLYPALGALGVTALRAPAPGSREHERYLRQMGFAQTADGYTLDLKGTD